VKFEDQDHKRGSKSSAAAAMAQRDVKRAEKK